VALAAAVLPCVVQAQAPPGARSVVRVICRLAGGQESRGSGFVWRSPTSVVTALHVVAGCSSISVESEHAGNGVSATIDKVLLEGDLALLRLEKTLGLEPLSEATTVNLNEEHSIWGYPKDVRTMQGDDIRFSRGLKAAPTLEDVMTQAQYLRSIGNQGFPAWRARILRVSSTILPGHSGAPIFDKAGLIVGIGDGGLHQGVQRINWAIPAGEYLKKLASSADPTRVQRGTSSAHFAEVIDRSDPPEPATASGDGPVLVWSASLRDILLTADDDARQDTEKFIAEAKTDLGLDLGAAILDFYEDSESGWSTAVPVDKEVAFVPDFRLFEATSDSGRVTVYMQIARENATESMESFWEFLEDLEDWEIDRDSDDEETRDDDGQVQFSRMRVATDANDEQTGQLISTMTVDDDGGFLGVAVVFTDMDAATPDDLRMLYLFAIGADLSGFAID
jgi:hypothetical protein